MEWYQRLEQLLEHTNYRSVTRALGFSKNRLYLMVREHVLPNVVDAMILCRFLGVSAEDVFGDTVDKRIAELTKTAERESPRPPPDHRPHAEAALQEALRQKRDADAKLRRLGNKKSSTKKRTG